LLEISTFYQGSWWYLSRERTPKGKLTDIQNSDGRENIWKKSLSVQSFNYACDSGVQKPECDISMKGYRGNWLVIEMTLFIPALVSGLPVDSFVMNSTALFGWKILTHIDFNIARADNGGDMFGGLMIDDLKYALNGHDRC
jgi:hypothetical protein